MQEREIFLDAIEIADPAEQAAFVEQACGADANLRAQVEALLKSHTQAGRFLETPAAADMSKVQTVVGPIGASLSQADDDPGADRASAEAEIRKYLRPATRPGWLGWLGHYEIEKILGRGAFGIVARAFDEKLHRVVAIKLLNPELATTSPPRKRFSREARTAAAVTHENIVAIHAVEEEPIPYLVMEYIPGQTLQQRMDATGPLDAKDILRIGQQVAAGLAAAHAANLIHRDIKPSNILIVDGPAERAKISDFGLARAVDDASLTTSGMIAGTPMYMAPEQARGESLDPRADLFSLGSVMYQMATGRPPFRAANAVAVLKRVVEETPRPIREIISTVPVCVCEIIEKLHAKRPEDRFQSALEVHERLADAVRQLNGEGPSRAFVAHRAARPRFPLYWVGAAIALIALGTWMWPAHQSPISDQPSERPTEQVLVDPDVKPDVKPDVATRTQAVSEAVGNDDQPGADSPDAAPSRDATDPEWRALKALGEAARNEAVESPAASQARWKLHQFARLKSGTAGGNEALKLLQSLRWPVDSMRRDDIGDDELQAAGHGDAAKAPAEIVAIFGDSRLKHWSGVTAVACSPDGRRIASAGFDQTILISDAETGSRVRTILGLRDGDPRKALHTLVFSPDGALLAGAGSDGSARIWNAQDGSLRCELEVAEGGVSSLAFTAGGQRLVTATSSGQLRESDVDKGTTLKSVVVGPKPVLTTALPGRSSLVVVDSGGTIRQFEATTLEPIGMEQDLKLAHGVSAIASDPTERLVALGTRRGEVVLWNVAEGKVQRQFSAGKDNVSTLAFDRSGKKIAVASDQWELRGFDVETGERSTTTHLHHVVLSVVASPTRNQWIAGWGNSWTTIVDQQTGSIVNPDPGPIFGFDVSWDGDHVAATHRESSRLTTWDVSDPRQMRPMKSLTEWDDDVAFAPEGQRLVSVGGNWICKLWNPHDRSFVAGFNRHDQWIYTVDFHPDGNRVATAAADRTARISNLLTRQFIHRLEGHSGDVWKARFSRDGQWLTTVCGDGQARVWETETAALKLQVGGRGPLHAATISPDRRLLLTIHSREALLWSTDTGALLRSLDGHESGLSNGDFSPDGKQVTTSCHDGAVRLWNPETGELLRTIRLHPTNGLTQEVRFSPEGRHLWTYNQNGTLYVLRL